MPDTVLTESQYLPPIEYFTCLSGKKQLRIERYENFQKQSYRNRCIIRGANNLQRLTIPVMKVRGKTLIRDLKICNAEPWNREHRQAIVSAYGKAPFFEHFFPYLEPLYLNPATYLIDFNYCLLTLCRDLLSMDLEITFTESYQSIISEDVSDLRGVISPKRSYQERGLFLPRRYAQVFGKNFVENLSILDLLMNTGSDAPDIVTNSKLIE